MSDFKPIYVTQPNLPPLEELKPYLESIWSSKILTNNGPFHQQLERELRSFLGVEHICLFSNGTIALITALRALGVTGEVITTPYSFVATAHALLWNGIAPKFVDIDRRTFNIDAQKIEEAITDETTAILPVHCYGRPCDNPTIQDIASKYSLKVIYDAAHAFGVRQNNSSILNYGDLSVLSFHATKVFNTFEGGAIVCPDIETKQLIDHLKNFGFEDEVTVTTQGINGKMSELNSVIGIAQLPLFDAAIQKRKAVDQNYRDQLAQVNGISCACHNEDYEPNFSYFPILVESEYPESRDALYERLKKNNIFSRRYFYPLISSFPMYSKINSAAVENLPVANSVANKILCLPIFPDLSPEQQQRIIDLVAGKT
jgi:dTDP-4-amino-4,6-dideoxygalactose transaminase